MAASQTIQLCAHGGYQILTSASFKHTRLSSSFTGSSVAGPLRFTLRLTKKASQQQCLRPATVRAESSPKEQLRCQAVALSTPEPSAAEEQTRKQPLGNAEEPVNAPKNIFQWLEKKLSPRARGLALLNLLTFLYGSNLSIIKEGQESLDAFSFSIGRFVIAAMAFSPFLRRALENPVVRRAGLELGVWASAGYVSQAVGLESTEAGRAAFIGTFTVIEVPLIAGLVFGAKIPKITWASAAAAVAGVALLETGASNSSITGEIWTIASALLFGIHMLRSEHHTRLIEPRDAVPLIALQLSVTAVLSIAWMLLLYFSGIPISGLETLLSGDWAVVQDWPWWQMLYTGVLSTAFCLWVEVVALRDVSAAEAAMVYTLEPLWGASFAWVLLNERWGTAGWIGAGMILMGSLTMQLFGKMEEPEKEGDDGSPFPLMSAVGAATVMAVIMAFSGEIEETKAGELPSAAALQAALEIGQEQQLQGEPLLLPVQLSGGEGELSAAIKKSL